MKQTAEPRLLVAMHYLLRVTTNSARVLNGKINSVPSIQNVLYEARSERPSLPRQKGSQEKGTERNTYSHLKLKKERKGLKTAPSSQILKDTQRNASSQSRLSGS